MADYKERRVRKRASGGSVKGEGAAPPHGLMVIIVGGPKPKKKAGGEIEGKAARKHMGKRARGGPPSRASGGHANPAVGTVDKRFAPMEPIGKATPAADYLNDKNSDEQARRDSDYRMDNGGFGKAADGDPPERARGGRTFDAGQAANNPDGRDRVSHGSGTDERDVEMGDARASGGHVKFRTPSGGVSAGARKQAEGKGEAMPGGRFPIRNTSDLSNAKHAFGRANDKPAVKRWIDKRAKELGKPPLGGE